MIPRISFLLLWSGGRQCMELILCRVVESSCLPTHNIVPHISWHDLPCHRTTKRYSDFPSMVIFHLIQREFRIQTLFCDCLQYLCLFHTVFEYIPSTHDQGKMLVLPNQLLCLLLSTTDWSFVSSQPIWCHPRTLIRIILFYGVRASIPNWRLSHNRIFNRIFSNCLSHNSAAEGWPYRFRSTATTGSSTLNHDLGHLCFGRRIQISGHFDLGIFINFGSSSIVMWL